MTALLKRSVLFRLAIGGCAFMAASLFSCLMLSMAQVPTPIAFVSLICFALLLVGLSLTVGKKTGIKCTREKRKKAEPAAVAAMTAAAVLIAVQVALVMSYRSDLAETVRPIAVATAVYDSGKLAWGDPMMLLVGTLSSVLHIHPLVFIYRIAPVILITFYYICYASVIESATEDNRARLSALVILCALNIWGYQSKVMIPITLLLTWYGLGVFIVHGILNVLAAILIEYLRSRPPGDDTVPEATGQEQTEGDIEPEEWDMKKHRIINARNLAIALAVIAAALVAVVFVLNKKINDLYNVTVSLEEDINNRAGLYEFTGSDGTVAGYLLKGSDGTLTFVGGGNNENYEDLKEFFSRYGTVIDKWYIYGEDDENAGAMRALTDSGAVTANNIYVINREEITP